MTLINVTQEDINKGDPCSAQDCAVALALKRAGYKRVSVGATMGNYRTTVMEGSKSITRFHKFSIPKHITDFIDSFDRGKRVEPISFILNDGGIFASTESRTELLHE